RQRFSTVKAFVDALEEAFVTAAAGGSVRAPISAPASPVANPPPSLTQQFFAEGDQLDNAHAAAHVEETDEAELETTAGSVPGSRAQMILAGFLALASVAVIAWTVVSLADRPSSSQTAQLAPPAAIAHPVTISAPRAQAPARAIDRDPRAL